jgi:predicted Zn finger-like uncharacterized protein
MPEQIRCPSCDAALRVPETLLGQNVKCPKCETTFVAEMEELNQPEGIVREPAPAAARRRPRLSEDDEYEEEDLPLEEEEDRPRRRRRSGRRYEDARAAVAGPATALMIVSGLALALSVLSLLGNLLGVGLMAAAPARKGAMGPQGPDLAINMIAGVGSAIFGLVYWTIATIGAVKMKNLSSYGFAMTACILGMLPCSLCCVLGLPFGIWGLVVLNRPEVKDAFS